MLGQSHRDCLVLAWENTRYQVKWKVKKNLLKQTMTGSFGIVIGVDIKRLALLEGRSLKSNEQISMA